MFKTLFSKTEQSSGQETPQKILGMSPMTLSLVAAGTTTVLFVGHSLHQRRKQQKAKEIFYTPTSSVTSKPSV
jgi:hypothetical protein